MLKLLVIAALFCVCGVGILLKQASAASCPVHSRNVGRWAVALAVLSIIAGAAIATLAVIWFAARR